MDHPTMFNSTLGMGNFITGSGLLNYSWDKIVDLQNENHSNEPNLPLTVRHKVYHHNKFGTIIVFVSSPPSPEHFREDFVPSENINLDFLNFEFVDTRLNSSFSINKAAVDLYASIQNELSSLNQYVDIRPLLITGHSIAGSIASLFTFWLLENMSLETNKCPLCITFGSPFLGDSGFQHAISKRPTWHSSFLHVISAHDPIPYLFTSIYKPFGTFLLCSDSGCAFFEEPNSVLDLMGTNRTSSLANFGSNEPLQVFGYGSVLDKLTFGAIFRGVSELRGHDSSPLREGILIQMKAIGERTQVCGDIASTIEAIEKRMIGLLDRKRKVFDPKHKLSNMKIHMAHIEWYKKVTVSKGGYYDNFKSTQSRMREEIVKRKNVLLQYWLKLVNEVEKMPKKEGAFLGIAWLYGGTNYRRLVEPLDIAEWYRKGKTNYLATRSKHYKLLEKWVKDAQDAKNDRKLGACSLTRDSCFWAHVEEAIIKCRSLSGSEGGSVENKENLMEDLVKFENYVMGLIENYAVDTEIFLKQSSFMRWWENYEKIRGHNYRSSLTDYMRNHIYKEYVSMVRSKLGLEIVLYDEL